VVQLIPLRNFYVLYQKQFEHLSLVIGRDFFFFLSRSRLSYLFLFLSIFHKTTMRSGHQEISLCLAQPIAIHTLKELKLEVVKISLAGENSGW
jgi:hypothetical protein